MIKLTIERNRENTNYKEELREYNNRPGYSQVNSSIPMSMIKEQMLDVEITEEQFAAIRKAVLESF